MILVVQHVLAREELERIHASLDGARFSDGRESAGVVAREQKHVLQLDRAGNEQREVGELVARALLRHPQVQAAALPKSVRHPTINRYEPGMYYGPHLDAAILRGAAAMRADVSVTVFLSPPSDYLGGELVVENGHAPIALKAAAGTAVLYPSGAIHQVKPVVRGARLVAVTWLQSLVRDPEQRRQLFELSETIALLETQGASADTLLRLRATHENLTRMWADV
jgi:PKHD-type hydroxylase